MLGVPAPAQSPGRELRDGAAFVFPSPHCPGEDHPTKNANQNLTTIYVYEIFSETKRSQ